jgi:hypothetical protein
MHLVSKEHEPKGPRYALMVIAAADRLRAARRAATENISRIRDGRALNSSHEVVRRDAQSKQG